MIRIPFLSVVVTAVMMTSTLTILLALDRKQDAVYLGPWPVLTYFLGVGVCAGAGTCVGSGEGKGRATDGWVVGASITVRRLPSQR